MTAKEYLEQIRLLDEQIDSKIAQVDSLNLLAEKVTATITGMPKNPSHSPTPMADTICRIVDLEREITAEIDELIDLKIEVMSVIKRVDDKKYRLILEKRYLCFQTWERIAADMKKDRRWLYRLHGKALLKVQEILDSR